MSIDSIKTKIKESKFAEFTGKLSSKTKKIIIAILILVIVLAVVIAVLLNKKDYVPLFTDVPKDEQAQIVTKLQDDGVEYKCTSSGTIMVPEKVADKERASLAMAGYPKSGFSYDFFTEHAGGMTTDSERDTYKLYELQNRIGATINLFEGVKDAKVTIALKPEKKYAIESSKDKANKSSASIVVVMEDNEEPSKAQARAIQRLVAKSVPDMKIEDVAVFDGNGYDISDSSGKDSSGQETSKIIEDDLNKKVINVLSPFYGAENIRVSSKGKVNMEKVVRETTKYRTPEKIDEDDKNGIVSKDTQTRESSNGGAAPGGVAGTETNADVSEYTNNNAGGGVSYKANSRVRDFLVDQIKEQGEIDPGVLQNITVSVSINGNNMGVLSKNEAIALIGNATGIEEEDQASNITVVAAPFYKEPIPKEPKKTIVQKLKDNWMFLLIPLLLIIILVIFLKKRKKKAKEEELLAQADADEFFDNLELQQGDQVIQSDDDKEKEAIMQQKSEKSQELLDTVRTFTDENPEISAQMLRSWLNGGDSDE